MKPEFRDKVKLMINKRGFKETLRLFGDKEVIKRAYQDNPSEFLNQLNDLTSIEKSNVIYYVDKDKRPLLYYYPNKKNGNVYMDYDSIWMFFSEVIGLEYSEIQTIIKNWLEETYNLRGLTPDYVDFMSLMELEETYNLRGLTPKCDY
jgi:hypothetical protein